MTLPPDRRPGLTVAGATEHYLHDITCHVPPDSFTVVCGVSGSGKSSLVFDTICREGQRRFLETLSGHSRGFFGKMRQPSCRSFSGLRPTLAVAQRGQNAQSRSTVGTMSDLYDYLRVLFSRIGQPHCPTCKHPCTLRTREELSEHIGREVSHKAVIILAPIVHGHRGSFRRELDDLHRKGFKTARIDGTVQPVFPIPVLDGKLRHDIELVIGENLLPDSEPFKIAVKSALEKGRGALLYGTDADRLKRLSTGHACPECGWSPPELGPRLFSFNSPYGACSACKGLGTEDSIDPDLLVGDPRLTLRQGVLVLTTPKGYIIYSQVTMDVLNKVCQAHGFSVDVPWENLTPEQKKIVFFGSDLIKIPFGKHPLESRLKWTGITVRPREEDHYKGILPVMDAILQRDRNPNILRFVRSRVCQSCGGSRLNPQAVTVTIHGQSIAALSSLSLDHLEGWLASVPLDSRSQSIAAPLFTEMRSRLSRLSGMGLGHLALNRPSSSLSAGEWQRIRLSMQAFTDLSGLLYVFDEPSLGLHPHDQAQLLDLMGHLKSFGNTVIAVEHRREAVVAADWIIDLGPGAGPAGGDLLFEGPLSRFLSSDGPAVSPSRDWLKQPSTKVIIEKPLPTACHPCLRVIGAREHNLKGIDVSFPLGHLIAVTGVSGAGKSTLVNCTLARFLRRKLHGASEIPGACTEIQGCENIDKVISVDQQPIGRNSRSNPATYTGVFDLIRDLYSRQPLAKDRGWSKSRFSWNVSGGRCEACEGTGSLEIGLHLLDPVEVRCDECGGRRYLAETLEVTIRGLSIGDVLDLPVSRAIEHFSDQKQILTILNAIQDVGLGYLCLGQSSTTLSGGEAQRLKLATELSRVGTGRTLYVLDEPATGLHHSDILLLSGILRRLVQAGNTVVAVEHHPEFLLSTDWIIDLGPNGGDQGGSVVVAGSPSMVMACPDSYTGKALSELLKGISPLSTFPRSPIHPPIEIRLEGVRTHNLKNLRISFPHQKLSVVTGVSGSGKSSLVMDTLRAESHRRFIGSLSSYARRFVQQVERPTLTSARGVTPVIAISDRRGAGNPRSTVGTMTGSLDLLRLLFSRAGTRHCPVCDTALANSICPTGHFQGLPSLTAGVFSFNNVQGACLACHGLGIITVCDPHRLITHPELSLLEGALDGTRTGRFYGERHGQYVATLNAVGKSYSLDFSLPWKDLPEEGQRIALNGCGEQLFSVTWKFKRGKRSGEHNLETAWPGLLSLVQEEYDRKRSDERSSSMSDVMSEQTCPGCLGDRLIPELRSVRWLGHSISDLSRQDVETLFHLTRNWDSSSGVGHSDAAFVASSRAILAALSPRLEWLCLAGLGYLSLDRAVNSLSGGEFRRLILAGQLNEELTGVTYLLDEPTIGLHSQDSSRLLQVLRRLRDLGNTVIVVEHDPDLIRSADHLIEIGPGAGTEGGNLVAAGSWADVTAQPDCLTARWLAPGAPWPERPTSILHHPGIQIRGASVHNLRNLDVDIPLRGLIAVTGVSGSGKTSLINDVLLPSLQNGIATNCRSCYGHEAVTRTVLIDQHLPGGSENSLIATLSGVLDPIRALFAKTEEAQRQRLGASAFSPFSSAGRCPVCQGRGGARIDLDFLADVHLVCEECEGSRFRPEVLACHVQNLSIAEVLDLTISGASEFFGDQKTIQRLLNPLLDVGLGHLTLGRTTVTLSSGERQRLRLALALTSDGTSPSPCLFVFDEPTTGLHLADVARLLSVFQTLLAAGNSLIVVEHHLELIRRADWVIDLGPGGGNRGGQLVFAGRPGILTTHPTSATGQALKQAID